MEEYKTDDIILFQQLGERMTKEQETGGMAGQIMDCRNPQKETTQKETYIESDKDLLQKLCESLCMDLPFQEYLKSRIFRQGIQQLIRIIELQQTESEVGLGVLSTSSDYVEKEIAKHTIECLGNSDAQTQDTASFLSLLKDYRVVQSLDPRDSSVSLLRLYSILQDNYKSSPLCGLLDIFITEKYDVKSKIITF